MCKVTAAVVWSSNWMQTHPPTCFYIFFKWLSFLWLIVFVLSKFTAPSTCVCGMLQMLEYAQDLIQKQGMTETEVTITVSTSVWWCTNVVEPTARDQPSWAVLLISALSIKWQSSEGKLWWCLNGGRGGFAYVWTWHRLTSAFSLRLGVWEFVGGHWLRACSKTTMSGVMDSGLAARQQCQWLVAQGLQQDSSVGGGC